MHLYIRPSGRLKSFRGGITFYGDQKCFCERKNKAAARFPPGDSFAFAICSFLSVIVFVFSREPDSQTGCRCREYGKVKSHLRLIAGDNCLAFADRG